jgi:hypothetical protein
VWQAWQPKNWKKNRVLRINCNVHEYNIESDAENPNQNKQQNCSFDPNQRRNFKNNKKQKTKQKQLNYREN